MYFYSQAKYLTKKPQAASVEAVKMLDEILLQLSVSEPGQASACDQECLAVQMGTERRAGGADSSRVTVEGTGPHRLPCPCALQASVPVDVMPGEFDPTNYTLPQQPLHPCMFPLATAYSTLQLVTNPYQATIDGVR